MSKITSSPYYVDHQFYDDVGDLVRRPPLRARVSGYFALRGESFHKLEQDALRLLGQIEIGVDPLQT